MITHCKARKTVIAFAALMSALALLVSAARSQAGEDSAAQSMPSSWEGIYNILGGWGPEGAAALGDLKPLHPDHGAEATAHLLPWAKLKMQTDANFSAVDDLGAICGPTGFFRHPTTVAGYMLMQVPGEILLISEDLGQVGVRRIFMTDKHPANIPPTWNGHSIGRWEQDTLVVDTIGFNDRSWLGSELQPHTEDLHVIERIRLIKDGQVLEIFSTIDDAKALSGPYSYSRYYKRTQQQFEQAASTCNENPGDQATWVWMRQQAILQFARNRATAGE